MSNGLQKIRCVNINFCMFTMYVNVLMFFLMLICMSVLKFEDKIYSSSWNLVADIFSSVCRI